MGSGRLKLGGRGRDRGRSFGASFLSDFIFVERSLLCFESGKKASIVVGSITRVVPWLSKSITSIVESSVPLVLQSSSFLSVFSSLRSFSRVHFEHRGRRLMQIAQSMLAASLGLAATRRTSLRLFPRRRVAHVEGKIIREIKTELRRRARSESEGPKLWQLVDEVIDCNGR